MIEAIAIAFVAIGPILMIGWLTDFYMDRIGSKQKCMIFKHSRNSQQTAPRPGK